MQKINIFGLINEKYKIKKPIRLIELFAGYGSQALALKYLQQDNPELNIKFEHYKVCEFDKTAIKTYNEMHNTSFETSDIRELKGGDLGITNKKQYEYIMTYSFP